MIAETDQCSAPLFYLVLEGEAVIGAALRTDHERPLSVSCMPAAAAAVLAAHPPAGLGGCVGDRAASTAFAEIYAGRHHLRPEVYFEQGTYELKTVRMPSRQEVGLVRIEPQHRAVAERFYAAFSREVFGVEPPPSILRRAIDRLLRNRSLYFLQDAADAFVSMAGNVRQTENTACVSYVYTPPEHRKKGYGALVTALLSERLLASGKSACNLFTDLANPTSNAIYKKIGYVQVGSMRHFRFMTPQND